jgi:hypothetical protein
MAAEKNISVDIQPASGETAHTVNIVLNTAPQPVQPPQPVQTVQQDDLSPEEKRLLDPNIPFAEYMQIVPIANMKKATRERKKMEIIKSTSSLQAKTISSRSDNTVWIEYETKASVEQLREELKVIESVQNPDGELKIQIQAIKNLTMALDHKPQNPNQVARVTSPVDSKSNSLVVVIASEQKTEYYPPDSKNYFITHYPDGSAAVNGSLLFDRDVIGTLNHAPNDNEKNCCFAIALFHHLLVEMPNGIELSDGRRIFQSPLELLKYLQSKGLNRNPGVMFDDVMIEKTAQILNATIHVSASDVSYYQESGSGNNNLFITWDSKKKHYPNPTDKK